jgi:hypothetical protein
MLDTETIPVEGPEITERRVSSNSSRIFGHQNWVIPRLPINKPSPAIIQIDHRVVPDGGRVQNRVIIDVKNFRQIVQRCGAKHKSPFRYCSKFCLLVSNQCL